MLDIFHDMIEESVEVFMDDFSVFGNSFDNCLNNLDKMLQRCKDANLVLNWEKCHFMVKEGIVLGHKVSGAGLEVDKKSPKSTNTKLHHPPRYMLDIFHDMIEESVEVFMDDISVFGNSFDNCLHNLDKMLQRFEYLRYMLDIFHDMIEESVEVFMDDISVFGNSYDNCLHNLDKMLQHFEVVLVIEKELMVVVFAFDKFRPYHLVLSKTVVYTDHSALRHLFKKQDAKPHRIRWILVLQEFDIKIKDKRDTENVAADHLSQIKNDETSDDSEVDDNFPGETLMEITTRDIPWFADFANYLVGDIIP
ncbi:reverse transcriptase domain-containing protein [Tanacetum coccineum]